MLTKVSRLEALPQIAGVLPALLMLGAAANALVVRIVEAATSTGSAADLGVTPFQIVILFVAARLSLGSGEMHRSRYAALFEAATLALILVPSSTVSWMALAFYASTSAMTATGERRQGALLFLGLALTAIWSSLVLKFIAMPVTTAEAAIVGKMLALLRPDIIQTGNVIGNPETHNLILMTRCTTTDALPSAIVSLIGVALLLGPFKPQRAWRAAAILAVVLFVANCLRLCAMAWSADAYATVHGPVGANIFDAFQALLVLALANWMSRP